MSRFISKSTDKCIPFFDLIRKGKRNFEWTTECEGAFRSLVQHLSTPPILSKPVDHEQLYLYLAVSEHAISAALVREEDKVQNPVYYVSKRLTGAERNYLRLEKLAYCLVIASRKLRPYFQAHPLTVYTDQPLRQVLTRPETSGRLLKWNIELSQFDIAYAPRRAIQGQVLADFIAEFTVPEDLPETSESPEYIWKLYTDGASNDRCSGAGVVLETPEGRSICYALKFDFRATNNEAEYEALLTGLRLARDLRIVAVEIYCDSQLVVCQVRGEYQARDRRLAAYLARVQEILNQFDYYAIYYVPRELNQKADSLA